MTVCCPARRPPALPKGLWQECSCAVLGGLLCSSCCLIQLLLNSFSIGCAGFSSLTSYRPVLLSVTAATLLGNYLKYKNKRRTALAVAVAFGLTVTPEIVQLYNQNRLPNFLDLVQWSRHDKVQGSSLHGSSDLTISVTGLKCQACCARLKGRLMEFPAVQSCSVDFERAKVHVRGSGIHENDIVSAISQLGYEAEIIKRSQTNDPTPSKDM